MVKEKPKLFILSNELPFAAHISEVILPLTNSKVPQNARSSIIYLRPLYKIAMCFALAPPYNFNKNQITSKLKCKTYGVFVMVLTVCLFVYSTHGKYLIYFRYLGDTDITVQIVLLFCTTMVNVTSVLASFTNMSRWKFMLHKFSQIDSKLKRRQVSKTKKRFVFKLELLGTILVTLLYIYHGFVYGHYMGIWKYRYFFFGRLQNILVHLFVLLVCNFVLAIKLRLEYLNILLKQKLILGANNKKLAANFLLDNVSLLRIYVGLKDISETFNDIFGWPILFLLFLMAAGILDVSNFIITTGLQDRRFGFTMAASFVLLSWGFFVIYLCELAAEEGKRTAFICQKILMDVPQTSLEQENIQQLLTYSTHHAPIFRAANIMVINLSTMFAIFGSLVTYVIILIQFN